MRQRGSLILTGFAFGVILLMTGCGSASAPGGPAGGLKVVMHAANYGAASSRLQSSRTPLSATNTNNGADGITAPSMGILSGPPLAMTVYLQSVALTQGNSAQGTALWTSTAANTSASGFPVTGCPIALTSGNPDLSGCAGLSALTVPAGTYTGLTLTFSEVGDIKGCLKGTFLSVTQSTHYTNTLGTTNPNTFYYPTPFPQTFFAYVTDAVTPATPYTYCTRKDQSYFKAETASITAIGNDASYQSSDPYFTTLSTPDFVSIDLGSGNSQNSPMATLEKGTVTINSSTVPTASSTTLTLAVDMNRILEFFANVRNDFNPPNPTEHTGTSYFFSGKFSATGGAHAVSAVSAFAGAVGTVEGYQLTATQLGQSSPAASGWFTLYRDAAGNYLGGSFYEDDDNELTIMKGNATITSGTLTAGATISLDIAGTVTGFTSTAVNGTGSCSLSQNSTTYTLAYQRLL